MTFDLKTFDLMTSGLSAQPTFDHIHKEANETDPKCLHPLAIVILEIGHDLHRCLFFKGFYLVVHLIHHHSPHDHQYEGRDKKCDSEYVKY